MPIAHTASVTRMAEQWKGTFRTWNAPSTPIVELLKQSVICTTTDYRADDGVIE
jgi:hypothetical protein